MWVKITLIVLVVTVTRTTCRSDEQGDRGSVGPRAEERRQVLEATVLSALAVPADGARPATAARPKGRRATADTPGE